MKKTSKPENKKSFPFKKPGSNLPAVQEAGSPAKASATAGYAGSGNSLSTQDKQEPANGTETEEVYNKMYIRTTDRSPKDALSLQTSIIAAESVYYPNQSRLFDLYLEVLRDLILKGIIRKLIAQIMNKNLLFKKNGEIFPLKYKDAKQTDVIRSRSFRDVCREVLWTPFWGINGLEFVPGEKLKFKLIPKKHIKIKTQKITYEQHGLTEGIDYTKLANVWIIGDEQLIGGNGSEHDLGLLFICAYYVLLKKGVVADWAQYIQIFGSPAIVVKYKGFDQLAKIAADKVLDNIGNANRITIPEEMGVEFIESKGAAGTGDVQDKFIQNVDKALSILILGNTETTGHDKTGTGGKSKTHSEQQLEIIRDAMDYVTSQLNSEKFLNILRSYNLDVDGGEFEFDKEVDIAYLKDYIPLLVQLGTQLGLPLSKKHLYEITGAPKPENDEDAIQLFPTLGQQEPAEPDLEDGKPTGKPTPVKKKPAPKPQAITAAEVSAMLDEKFSAFFGPAR